MKRHVVSVDAEMFRKLKRFWPLSDQLQLGYCNIENESS